MEYSVQQQQASVATTRNMAEARTIGLLSLFTSSVTVLSAGKFLRPYTEEAAEHASETPSQDDSVMSWLRSWRPGEQKRFH